MKRSLLTTTAVLSVAMMSFGAAEANSPSDWSGFFAGFHAGSMTGDVEGIDGDTIFGGTINGPVGGRVVGYNFQSTGPIVLGVEADFGIADVDGTGTDISVDIYQYDLKWNSHLRVRAGLPHGSLMPFIAAGVAFADFELTEEGATVRAATFRFP